MIRSPAGAWLRLHRVGRHGTARLSPTGVWLRPCRDAEVRCAYPGRVVSLLRSPPDETNEHRGRLPARFRRMLVDRRGTGGPEECIRSGLHGAMCYVAGEVPRGRDRADCFRRSFPIAQLARTQDVGGCRAILPSIAGIREVVHEFERCRLVLPLSFRNSPPHGTDAGRRHHRRGSTRSPVCRTSTSKSLSL